MSHIEQECQESLIQENIHIQQNSNEGLEYGTKAIWYFYLLMEKPLGRYMLRPSLISLLSSATVQPDDR